VRIAPFLLPDLLQDYRAPAEDTLSRSEQHTSWQPRRRAATAPGASADLADIVQREQSVGAPAELYGADN
jgi:hypothetical protein